MIGHQPVGAVPGVAMISSTVSEGLIVTYEGRPAQLAVVDDRGQVVAIGAQVAREAEATAINAYREFLQCHGWLRTYSAPIKSHLKPRRDPA